MKAILVSVNYADLLAVTLPYNRRHFDKVLVVTAPGDLETARVAGANNAGIYVTDAFTRNGAVFNKWAALEEGLDALGREGWLCIMDADVLWPQELQIEETTDGCLFIGRNKGACGIALWPGQLCTPMRRMWDEWPDYPACLAKWKTIANGQQFPPESLWPEFPLHRQQREFAGYSQIFYASDPALGPAPWHQIDWTHAGGADSFFQAKWPDERKVRPPFEVLHLGPAGQNWFGRATPLADGMVLPGSDERREMSGQKIWAARRANRAAGRDQFDGEKID